MEHYYSEQPKSFLKLRIIRQKIKEIEFEFYTSSGIFSKNEIDRGTLILAENMQIEENSKVLDIGCGIGILGIAAAKLFNADVAMSDINKRVIMLTKKNAELNNVKAEIFQGNLYEKIEHRDFDVILSNPPQNAGKKICFELIEKSKQHLKENGSLQLVARHNKGGKALGEKMREVFGNLKVIAKKSGYWVYIGETRKDEKLPVSQWGLTGKGLKSSKKLAENKSFGDVDIVISSGEKKAYQTAKPIAGRLKKEIIRINFEDFNFTRHGWETSGEALNRFKNAVEKIDKKYEIKMEET